MSSIESSNEHEDVLAAHIAQAFSQSPTEAMQAEHLSLMFSELQLTDTPEQPQPVRSRAGFAFAGAGAMVAGLLLMLQIGFPTTSAVVATSIDAMPVVSPEPNPEDSDLRAAVPPSTVGAPDLSPVDAEPVDDAPASSVTPSTTRTAPLSAERPAETDVPASPIPPALDQTTTTAPNPDPPAPAPAPAPETPPTSTTGNGGESPPASQMCDGLEATIVGTNQADILIGTEGADVIVGGNGQDIIFGLGGDDVICGGNGKDDLHGGAGDDRLFGGNGDDDIKPGAGDDHVMQ